jgi:O-antigen ligase
MPPNIALLLFVSFVAFLIILDKKYHQKVSVALWVPIIWFFIIGSRLPSQWFGYNIGFSSIAFEEGNSLDRSVYIILMLIGTTILIKRRIDLSYFLRQNTILVIILMYSFLSFFWSEYPFVAFKRWIRDFGTYLMVLVVLTDSHPIDAFKMVFKRLCFIKISFSILLIKYFLDLGRAYNYWDGRVEFIGVTTSKNMLGVLCLVCGLFLLWDLIESYKNFKIKYYDLKILINIIMIIMTLYLLYLSSSATSAVCLTIGCLIIWISNTKITKNPLRFTRNLGFIVIAILFIFFAFGYDLIMLTTNILGRDPTLTDRTGIWEVVLQFQKNSVFGAGYESFWLGERLLKIWESGYGKINQSHNGFLQVYLELGIIGLILIALFLWKCYKAIFLVDISKDFLGKTEKPLAFAFLIIFIIYNITEASIFKGILWVSFLLLFISIKNTDVAENNGFKQSF